MIYRAIESPDWFSRAAIYQINLRNFSAEGTINSVIQELDFLKKIGFSIIYICPIFKEDDSEDKSNWSIRQVQSGTENPKNIYRMNDYFTIDEEFGTDNDLHKLVNEAHNRGIRVILDLVYLHIGPNADILKTHPEFARQDINGKPICTYWRFPYLDFNHDGLREYLWCNMVYYISVFNIDGFRCDVGDQVPLDFWDEGKRRITTIKPDAVLIEEGVNQRYLLKCFDSLYCFSWHEVLYSAFTGKKPISSIRENWTEWNKYAPDDMKTLRDLDNHDTVTDWPERTEIAVGHDGMELILTINYLMDGIPMVFCGNELADESKLSMFANRFHMGKYETTYRSLKDTPACKRRNKVITKLNRLKKESDILRYGKTVWLDHEAQDKVIAFSRVYGNKSVTLIGNASAETCEVVIPGFSMGEILLSSEIKPEIEGKKLKMPSHSYIAFLR